MTEETKPEGAVEIRFLGDLHRVKVEPGDLFVLSSTRQLSADETARLRMEFEKYMQGALCLVLPPELKLGVMSVPQSYIKTVISGEATKAVGKAIAESMRKSATRASRNI